jgi:hypothetical protein
MPLIQDIIQAAATKDPNHQLYFDIQNATPGRERVRM